ncbi:hypothetical protein ACEZCY_24225 [Streptacidiphilus sp. N1-12]|uniref:Uncharacterized protein n=2 Tax=Streptacidiphilus alkalitolerans TaxID=3342712 RepID=A0ABV6WJZ7_9ACTN
MRASRAQLALISLAAALVAGVVAYGSSHTDRSKPVPISTPSLSPAQLSAVNARVTAWTDGPAGQHLVDLYKAMESLNGVTRTAEVSDDCDSITTAAAAGQAEPPIPDAPAQAHWVLALQDARRGALSCSAGAERGDANAVAIGVHSIGEGMTELNSLADRLDVLQSAK